MKATHSRRTLRDCKPWRHLEQWPFLMGEWKNFPPSCCCIETASSVWSVTFVVGRNQCFSFAICVLTYCFFRAWTKKADHLRSLVYTKLYSLLMALYFWTGEIKNNINKTECILFMHCSFVLFLRILLLLPPRECMCIVVQGIYTYLTMCVKVSGQLCESLLQFCWSSGLLVSITMKHITGSLICCFQVILQPWFPILFWEC